MFFLSNILVPLILIINPWQIVKLIQRKINYGKTGITQKQANQYMEDSKYSMGKKYSEIIQTLWFTYLYATLIPIGAFCSLFGLLCLYWADKYTLLKVQSVTENVSGDICIHELKLLDITLFLKPLGEIIFDTQIREGYSI